MEGPRLAESEVLFAVAEFSVAVAGFSAIVVILRRSESGKWRAIDADRFHGMLLPSTTSLIQLQVSVGFVFAGFLLLNVIGFGYSHEFRPYLGGVLWHAFQAGFLFVVLVWIAPADIESD